MKDNSFVQLLALVGVTAAFAWNTENEQDSESFALNRFARDLQDNRQRFAFAFSKRNADQFAAEPNQGRFARDADGKKKFAFAFAKRSDVSFASEPEENLRFARDVEGKKKFAVAFAKRSSDDALAAPQDDQMGRFARDLEAKKFAFAFAKRADEEDRRRFARSADLKESRFAFAKRGESEVPPARFARFA